MCVCGVSSEDSRGARGSAGSLGWKGGRSRGDRGVVGGWVSAALLPAPWGAQALAPRAAARPSARHLLPAGGSSAPAAGERRAAAGLRSASDRPTGRNLSAPAPGRGDGWAAATPRPPYSPSQAAGGIAVGAGGGLPRFFPRALYFFPSLLPLGLNDAGTERLGCGSSAAERRAPTCRRNNLQKLL